MIRTVWGDSDRYVSSYFPADLKGYYLAGDNAQRDRDGYYWIMGRTDDVLSISGHRLGGTEIESALVAHELVAEAAVVGRPDVTTGEAIVDSPEARRVGTECVSQFTSRWSPNH